MPKKRNTRRLLKRCLALVLAGSVALSLTVPARMTEKTIRAASENVIYGDVNSDKKINILDMILLKSYVNEENPKGFSISAADLDGDGEVSAKDAVELSMYLLNQTGSFSYEMNIDTDKDGLCDYIEKEILKTDYQNTDTDSDGLDDYSEIYLCDTDPTEADTGKTGVKDSLKDTDGDKLTNAEEIRLGISPSLTDTDEDGINDYDEVNKYKTDPSKEDSDGDGISDNGEIRLGLDPLKLRSDGKTSDAERTFEQKLSAESEMLKIINSEENPYKLSLSVKAAGYIGESVNADISAYSNYLQNDAVAGNIIDIDYADSFKTETLTINFTVSENSEKYYIFRYFEDVNMLLPVETLYDEKRVYTESAEDGTYCIVDMDKWISGTSAAASGMKNTGVLYDLAYASSEADTKTLESMEVYFLLYLKSAGADSTRSSVATASRAIIDYCNRTGRDIKIYFATYTGLTVVSKETQKSYVSNDSSDEEIEEMLSRSGTASANLDTTNFNYSLTRTLAKSLSEISKGNEDSQKYCFVVDVNFEPQSAADVAVINEMKDYGVDFSFICNDYNSNIANYESLSSDGSHYKWVPDFSDIVIDKVVGAVITYNVNTGLCRKISYNEKFITSEWKDIYEKYYSGKLSADDIKKSGLPDTDGDGAPDCLELFMKLITFDDDGNVILPTYDQVARDSLRNSVWGVKGLDELEDIMREKGIDIRNLLILPLISNPTFDDSDYDGIYDMYDEEPVMSSSTDLDVGIIDDTNIFDNGTMTDIRIDENGVFNYENLNGSTTVKKPTVTYTRYADSEKRSLTKFRLLYSGHYSDFKLSVETKYDNDVEVYVYPVDGGTALECEKTKGKNSRENIYGFTTLNNNHGYEKYIPFGWSEEKVPAWMVSSIKPSWAYCVDIYITPREFILEGRNEIKVKFEEDNWIYAPDGGVATSSALNYSALYLPEDALKVIVGKQEADKWEEYILDPAFPRLLRDAITYSYYKEEESHYLNMGEKGFEYKLVSEISTVSTFVGLGCLFASSAIPAEKFAAACTTIGNIATVSGATFTIFSPKNITEQDFRDETEACISEINPSNINLSLHNYDKFDRVGERYDCKEWVNNGYVYKYYYAGRDDSYRIIRTNELKKF